VSSSLSKALSCATSSNLGLQAAALSRLQIKGVLLGVGDYPLAGYLSFEPANCAFDALVIVNLDLCHSNPPLRLTKPKAYTSDCVAVNFRPAVGELMGVIKSGTLRNE
jgi:hypothetical protein